MANTTTKDYNASFSPKLYFETFHVDPKKNEYFLGRINEFWKQVEKTGPKKNMLEYGAGPTISRFIPAAKHVDSIIAAEYLEANRKAMKDWIENNENAFDWGPTFKYVIEDQEKLPAKEIGIREAAVREKIKAVIHCDVKGENHLELPSDLSPEYGPPFDVVSTCLTLEAVVETKKEYFDQVKYLANLLRPGGFLLLHGVLEQTFYTVGEKFYTFFLTKEMVLESMKEAGMKDITLDLATDHFGFEQFNDLPLADQKDFYFVHGRK